MTPEKKIVNKIQALVKKRGGMMIKTTPPGVPSGTPDLDGCYRGRSLKWEVKKDEKEQPSSLQRAMLIKWKKAGSCAGVMHDVEHAKMVLDALDIDPYQEFNNEEDWRFTRISDPFKKPKPKGAPSKKLF